MALVWEILVIAALALWLGLTIVNQFFAGSWPWLHRHDPLQLVPGWTFFAPEPGRRDLHLLYRDVFGDRPGDWAEVSLIAPRGLRAALWNPGKRGKKVLIDTVQSLLLLAEELGEATHPLKISVPYLLLLQVVTAMPREDGATARQFQVVESHGTFGGHEPRTVFRSGIHAL